MTQKASSGRFSPRAEVSKLFLIKVQIINILDFSSRIGFFASIEISLLNVKAAIDST